MSSNTEPLNRFDVNSAVIFSSVALGSNLQVRSTAKATCKSSGPQSSSEMSAGNGREYSL